MGPAASRVPTPLQPSAPLAWRELASLYRGEFAFVWRCVQRFGVPRSSADDATQDVFLRLFARWHTLDDRSLRGLLFVIARQVATDHHRRVRTTTEPVGEHEDATTLLPDELAGRREAATFLREFVESLDPEKRRVFVLAELEQCSAPEIARALEVPLGTVYSRHRAARLELDEALRRRRARERSASRVLEAARRSRPAPREGALLRGWLILWIRLGEPRPPVLATALAKPLLATVAQAIAGGVLAAATIVAVAQAIPRDEPIAIAELEIDEPPLAAVAVARVPIAATSPVSARSVEEEPEIE
ncbi:MAG TPA: sigma-70 family RNA polymerase sigma factor, partial [Nannocystaceae bacterium]|nr:sigma-70 family RNA polymerase sigma factor [Nannocystaceae bacterium]